MKTLTEIKTKPRYYMYKSFYSLSIHERINFRQYRNSLNINHLYLTSSSSYRSSSDSNVIQFPKINNGLYHHIGKTHSKYPLMN